MIRESTGWDLATGVSATYNTSAGCADQCAPVGRWPPGCAIAKKSAQYRHTCRFSWRCDNEVHDMEGMTVLHWIMWLLIVHHPRPTTLSFSLLNCIGQAFTQFLFPGWVLSGTRRGGGWWGQVYSEQVALTQPKWGWWHYLRPPGWPHLWESRCQSIYLSTLMPVPRNSLVTVMTAPLSKELQASMRSRCAWIVFWLYYYYYYYYYYLFIVFFIYLFIYLLLLFFFIVKFKRSGDVVVSTLGSQPRGPGFKSLARDNLGLSPFML